MPKASGPEVTTAAANPRQPPALRRWEVRVSEELLGRWRDVARRQGAGLADVVRAAMEIAAELPPGTVRDRLARAEADRAGAIRDASRGPGPGMPSSDIAPLSTRGAR